MSLIVEVPSAADGPMQILLAQVVHATALPGGQWLMGCTFLADELASEEMQDLLHRARAAREPKAGHSLARLYAGPAPRQTPGGGVQVVPRPAVLPSVLLVCAPSGRASVLLRVARLFFQGAWPPAPETVLRVRLTDRPDGGREATLKVHRCSQEQGRWVVTYSFVGSPPTEVLEAFGIGADAIEASASPPSEP